MHASQPFLTSTLSIFISVKLKSKHNKWVITRLDCGLDYWTGLAILDWINIWTEFVRINWPLANQESGQVTCF